MLKLELKLFFSNWFFTFLSLFIFSLNVFRDGLKEQIELQRNRTTSIKRYQHLFTSKFFDYRCQRLTGVTPIGPKNDQSRLIRVNDFSIEVIVGNVG